MIDEYDIQVIGEPVDVLSRGLDKVYQNIPRDINEALIQTTLPFYLKLIIHTKEDGHNLPHFHIKKGDKEAVCRIDEFKLLDGGKQISRKDREKIKNFWENYAQDLLCIWNESRPSDRKHQKANCDICEGVRNCSYQKAKYADFTSKGTIVTIGD